MAIIAIDRDWGVDPSIVRIDASTSTLTQVGTAGYLTAQAANIEAYNSGAFAWLASDMVLVYASDGWGFFTISSDFTSLNAFSLSPAVLGPTVDGHFANFADADGTLIDDGFLPSDATKTRVVMAGGAVVANHIALFQDTTGTIDDVAATAINNGPIQAGLSGTSGYLASFPPTLARGSLRIVAVDNTGDTLVTISNALHGQASVYSIPDSGQATAEFIISDFATTQHITSGALQVDAGAITSGLAAGGFVGLQKAFPTTGASGFIAIQAAVNATGDFGTTISNATAQAQAQVVTVPDAGAATANFLLDTGAANILAKQQFVGISEVLTFGTGTWTVTRIAQGNYVSRHTPGDETSIIAIDITPAIRVAASKGFRLDSFDVIYAIAANALDAHSVTLDRIAYANNVAVSVTSIAITGVLATATQANPYVTNVAIDAPAFDVTADTKYIIELTVNNAAASEYDYYGIMLRFSETIG